MWVPESLRPPQSRLWHLADNTTYGFGTPLGKMLPPWRWPANITSWKSLRRKHDGIACHRNAHLVVTELTEDNAGHTRSSLPGLIVAGLVALVGVMEIAVLLATITSVALLIIGLSVLGLLLWYVIALTTEFSTRDCRPPVGANFAAMAWRRSGRRGTKGRWGSATATCPAHRVMAASCCDGGCSTSTQQASP